MISDAFYRTGIVPVIRLEELEKAKPLAKALVKGGVPLAEVTFTEKVSGIKAENTDVAGGKLDRQGYRSVARQLVERFNLNYAAITLRTSLSANDNRWAAILSNGEECLFSKEYPIHIVDRVGGGDSFGAGLIYSFCTGMNMSDSLEFAVAASCLKHCVEGDFNRVSVEEIKALMAGDGSGRVQR